MKVPASEFALIEEPKVRHYLLGRTHPHGAGKARFFMSLGFRSTRWRQLAAALRAHLRDHEYEERVASAYGVKYVVRGRVQTAKGTSPEIVTIWIIERGRLRPRFVTAYPGGKR